MNLIYWVLSVHLIAYTPGGDTLLIPTVPARTEFETSEECVEVGRSYFGPQDRYWNLAAKISCTSRAHDCNHCDTSGNFLSCTSLYCTPHQSDTIEVTQ